MTAGIGEDGAPPEAEDQTVFCLYEELVRLVGDLLEKQEGVGCYRTFLARIVKQ